jgi:dTDP-glucose 4,6-dehydratase
MRVIVTGAAGFIGSAVMRRLARAEGWQVIGIDKLGYASTTDSIAGVLANGRDKFEQIDILDRAALDDLFTRFQPQAVMHLAAETHVDRSIDDAAPFIQNNIVGTFTLLEATRRYWSGLKGDAKSRFRFHHISTDEVYGALGQDGVFVETTPYSPRSPYAASKASADHLVMAWHHTYGLPVVISNCSNNYGPYQFPEKLIPLLTIKALSGEVLPVYGDGGNVRDWLYVDDHAEALEVIVTRGRVGEKYNVGGRAEQPNIVIVRRICALLDELRPRADGTPYAMLIRFVTDRPGHDFRYAIDCTKLEKELGWKPRHDLETGLRKTVSWILENPDWWGKILSGDYQGQRLGVGT